MARLPTANEKVRKVLDIFQHFNGRPGHVIRGNNLYGGAGRLGIPMEDVRAGLIDAEAEGLVERTNNGGFRLTEAGFLLM